MSLADRYLTKLPENFGDAFTSGIKKRQDFEESQRVDERRVISHDQILQQNELKQKQLDRQNAFDTRIQELSTSSDPRALVNLSKEYPDLMGEDMLGQINEQEKRVHTTLGAPVYAAAKNGNYELAASKARAAAKMMRDYGAEEEAVMYENFADDFEDEKARGPAVFSAGASLMQIMGRENFGTMFDVEKTEAETKDKQSITKERDAMLSGKLIGQATDIAETASQTKEREAMLEGKVEGQKLDQKKLAAEITKTNAEIKKLAVENDGKIPVEKRPETELKLRNQYLKETDDFQQMTTAYDKVLSAGNTPEGDIALIFSYMKMLDPNSVVREGEFDTAQKTAGITDQVWQAFEKAKTGKRLSDIQAKNLKEQAKKVFASGQAKEKRVRGRIKGQAENYGLNTKNIFSGETARVPEDPLAEDKGAGFTFPPLGGGAQTNDVKSYVDTLFE